jgi:hypothetical protein
VRPSRPSWRRHPFRSKKSRGKRRVGCHLIATAISRNAPTSSGRRKASRPAETSITGFAPKLRSPHIRVRMSKRQGALGRKRDGAPPRRPARRSDPSRAARRWRLRVRRGIGAARSANRFRHSGECDAAQRATRHGDLLTLLAQNWPMPAGRLPYAVSGYARSRHGLTAPAHLVSISLYGPR